MAVSKRLRYEILRRDNHACRYCGATAPTVKLNVDHVIPQALGGSDKPTNLVTACADCNSGKTSSLPNATPVADVEQGALREAIEARRAKEVDRLWRGHMPSTWDEADYWRYAAEGAWYHAWVIATDGQGPDLDAYNTFLGQRAALEDRGRSEEEILCAAVIAGAAQTATLNWGLSTAQARHSGLSGEQFTRMEGVRGAWVKAWHDFHGDAPTTEDGSEFDGRLVVAARLGHTREQLMCAARSAAMGRNADVDYFAHHIACDEVDGKVGGN